MGWVWSSQICSMRTTLGLRTKFLIASFSLYGVCPFCEYGNNFSCCHASTISGTYHLIMMDKFAREVPFEMTIMPEF